MYAYTNILFTPSRPCRTQSASDQRPFFGQSPLGASRQSRRWMMARNRRKTHVLRTVPAESCPPQAEHPPGRNKTVLARRLCGGLILCLSTPDFICSALIRRRRIYKEARFFSGFCGRSKRASQILVSRMLLAEDAKAEQISVVSVSLW